MNNILDKFVSGASEFMSKGLEFINDVITAILSVIDALRTLYDMLLEFDNKVLSMSAATVGYPGLPVRDAVATVRYLIGDMAFYMIYLSILFGCLFTIYKIVVLLFQSIDGYVQRISGGDVSSGVMGIIGKLLK